MIKENQMLARITKLFGPKATPTEAKDETQAAPELNTDLATLRVEFEAFQAEANALLEAADLRTADLTTQLKDAEEALVAAQAAVGELVKAKEEALKLAHETKMASRKKIVVDAIGETKADAFLAATEALDDAAFQAVSSALAGSIAAEANTALFTEIGVEGQADPTASAEEKSPEMRILEQKYKQQKPAN